MYFQEETTGESSNIYQCQDSPSLQQGQVFNISKKSLKFSYDNLKTCTTMPQSCLFDLSLVDHQSLLNLNTDEINLILNQTIDKYIQKISNDSSETAANIIVLGQIGNGGYGSVQMVYSEQDKKVYALKIFEKEGKSQIEIQQAKIQEIQSILKANLYVQTNFKEKGMKELGECIMRFSNKILQDGNALLFEIGDIDLLEFLKNLSCYHTITELELALLTSQMVKLQAKLKKLGLFHSDFKLQNITLCRVKDINMNFMHNFMINYATQLMMVDIGSLVITEDWLQNREKIVFITKAYMDENNKKPRNDVQVQFFSLFLVGNAMKTILQIFREDPNFYFQNKQFKDLFKLLTTSYSEERDQSQLIFESVIDKLDNIIIPELRKKKGQKESDFISEKYVFDNHRIIKNFCNSKMEEYFKALDKELSNCNDDNKIGKLKSKCKQTKNNKQIVKFHCQCLDQLNKALEEQLQQQYNIHSIIEWKLRQVKCWMENQEQLEISDGAVFSALDRVWGIICQQLEKGQPVSEDNFGGKLKLAKFEMKCLLFMNQYQIKRKDNDRFYYISEKKFVEYPEQEKKFDKYRSKYYIQKAQIQASVKEKWKHLEKSLKISEKHQFHSLQLKAYYLYIDDCLVAQNQVVTETQLKNICKCLNKIKNSKEKLKMKDQLFLQGAKFYRYQAKYRSIFFDKQGVIKNLNKALCYYYKCYRTFDMYEHIEIIIDYFIVLTKSWHQPEGLKIIENLQKSHPFLDPKQNTKELNQQELILFKKLSWGLAFDRLFKGRYQECIDIIRMSLKRQGLKYEDILSNKNYFDLTTLLGRGYAYLGDYQNTYKIAQCIENISQNHELYKNYVCESYYIRAHVEAIHQNFDQSQEILDVLRKKCIELKDQSFIGQAINSYYKLQASVSFARGKFKEMLDFQIPSYQRRHVRLLENLDSLVEKYDINLVLWRKQEKVISATQDIQYLYILYMIEYAQDMGEDVQDDEVEELVRIQKVKKVKELMDEIVQFYDEKFQGINKGIMDYMLAFVLSYFGLSLEMLDIFKSIFPSQLKNYRDYPNLCLLYKDSRKFFKNQNNNKLDSINQS